LAKIAPFPFTDLSLGLVKNKFIVLKLEKEKHEEDVPY